MRIGPKQITTIQMDDDVKLVVNFTYGDRKRVANEFEEIIEADDAPVQQMWDLYDDTLTTYVREVRGIEVEDENGDVQEITKLTPEILEMMPPGWPQKAFNAMIGAGSDPNDSVRPE